MALVNAKFFPCFAFSRRGLIFNSKLQSVLFVTDYYLLKMVV